MSNNLARLKVALDKERNAGRKEGREEGRQKVLDALAELRERNIASYRAGISDEEPCNAPAPGVRKGGKAVLCQLQAGQQVGPYDRHKAVYGEPHTEIVWNEPGTEKKL